MANGINNVNGYGYGSNVYGYGSNAKKEDSTGNAENKAQQNVQPEAKPQVNADDVMKFLENNNLFIAPAQTEGAEGTTGVDAATQARVEDAMAQFEVIYAIVVQEFGEEIAPAVMDMVMDRLIGLV